MNWFEALILGLLQGLTEFLPVSSSGHLELGNFLLHTESTENFKFSVTVHAATVLSTIIIFRKEILILLKHFFSFRRTPEAIYVYKLLVSMIPILLVGFFLIEPVESLFSGRIKFVGSMLLVTAFLLLLTRFVPSRNKPVTYANAFWIGVAQAIAVLPGISRSGSTIATALMLGTDKKEAAKFSFLMVLLPIIAINTKEIISGELNMDTEAGTTALIVGFMTAFLSGLAACRWMIHIVQKGNLFYFSLYCFVLGILAIFLG